LKGKTRCKKQCKTIKDRLMMQKTKGDRRQKMDGERQGRKTLVGRGKEQRRLQMKLCNA
jgi:hypothetical protein